MGESAPLGEGAELPLSTELLWEGWKGGAGEMGRGHWDSDTVFVAFQPWSFQSALVLCRARGQVSIVGRAWLG